MYISKEIIRLNLTFLQPRCILPMVCTAESLSLCSKCSENCLRVQKLLFPPAGDSSSEPVPNISMSQYVSYVYEIW